MALVSGAGSVCLARSPQGRMLRVGGWGHLLGDEGSGYRLAMDALRLATQTVDGRADADALLRTILRHWSLSDAVETAIRKLALASPPLALAGSLLRGDLRRMLLARLTSPLGEVSCVEDPCRGAVTLAKRLLAAAR